MKNQTGGMTDGSRRLRLKHPLWLPVARMWFSCAAGMRWLLMLCVAVTAWAEMINASVSEARTVAEDAGETPWIGEAGIREDVSDIMAREQETEGQGEHSVRIRPVLRPNRQGLPQNPDSPDGRLNVQQAFAMPAPGLLSPQTTGTSFTGATLADTSSFPPDTMGAVGPTQFIVAVNGRIRTFNKTTGVADGALNASMDTFFNSVMTPPTSSNFTSDPHIRYDRLSGRWIVIMIDVPGGGGALPNRVLLAVSSGNTVTSSSSFTFFYFEHDTVTPTGDTGNFADYPTLGIDTNAIYIGDNVFTPAGAYAGSSGFVVRKSSVLGAGPIVVTAFRGLVPTANATGPTTPQGVDNDDPAADEGYFIGVDNASFGKLIVRRVSTPGGTPTISSNISLTVPTTTYPITVPHLGNTGGSNGNLDALDDRLFAARIRNGRLWTAHNIQVNGSGVASGSGGRNGSRWYEIQNLTTTPSLVQSGTVFDSAASNPKNYWIPSIMVSGQGHVAMGFSTAGTTNRANAGTVGRLAGDTLGTMQTPVDYTASTTAYNPSGDPGGSSGRRWGDFSYTSLDPSDDMTMWTIQEFCDANNSYGVRAVRLLAPPPATPVSCSPASVMAGGSNVSVAVTGASLSGSGFFDPGLGFPKRLAAVVNGGGVTVTGVAFSNPSNITITVTVSAGAATGARTVTVTNADDQASTSAAGILTIVAAPPPTVTVSASKAGNGTISPTGAVTVAYNGTTNFLITADAGYHIGSILTNGSNLAGSPYSDNSFTSTNFVWRNVTTNGTVVANFAESFAPLGTPVPWLIQYGLTNGTPAAEELTDTDGDGLPAWQEYVAGTVPTNRASVFLSLIAVSNSVPRVTWTPDLGTARTYTVIGRTNLVDGVWGVTNAGSRFFKAKVSLP